MTINFYIMHIYGTVKEKTKRGSVEDVVENYLKLFPENLLSMREGVINLSKLSEQIKERNPGYNLISIRYALNQIRERQENSLFDENYVHELLIKSKISLQDKITVLTSRKPIDVNYISATYLSDSIVYVVDEMENGEIKSQSGISIERDVSALHIFSSKDIERVPGFVMRITERLFAESINILQLISCSNETLIIVNRKDAVKAYKALTF